jgi:hypothetical protein
MEFDAVFYLCLFRRQVINAVRDKSKTPAHAIPYKITAKLGFAVIFLHKYH